MVYNNAKKEEDRDHSFLDKGLDFYQVSVEEEYTNSLAM